MAPFFRGRRRPVKDLSALANPRWCVFAAGLLPDGKPLLLVPEGLSHEGATKCILGNGVVVDPKVLLSDLDNLDANGIEYADRLLISPR